MILQSNGIEESELPRPWSTVEVKRLREAEKQIDPQHPRFWQEVGKSLQALHHTLQVASYFPDRTAIECQEKWFGAIKSPDEKREKRSLVKPLGDKMARPNSKKYKQQLRCFVKNVGDLCRGC